MTDPGRLVRNSLRFAVGAPLFMLQHVRRQCYMQRSLSNRYEFSEQPPSSTPTTTGSDIQRREDGTGPLVMRTYRAGIVDARCAPAELIRRFCDDPNAFSPRHVAGFRTPDGNPAKHLTEGDEVVVEIPGPWNGPVRVDHLGPCSLCLVTLDGHMEAGHIRFTATHTADSDVIEFQIRSWARAGDQAFKLLHLNLPVARELQTAMWTHTCDRATQISGGRRRGPIRVDTEVLIGSERDGDAPIVNRSSVVDNAERVEAR